MLNILLIGVALSMDAFTVSICKGITIKKNNLKSSIIISLYFGVFQSLMPILGYILGKSFSNVVMNYDHWIAFIILSVIGINMIRDYRNEESYNSNTNFKEMIPVSIATSIDALTVGITFSFLKVNIIYASLIIGIITFILCFIGTLLGHKINNIIGKKSVILGGIILILIGLKILLEHLKII